MKVALCISGQPRYLDDGYSTIKKVFDRFGDLDVFVHTWWDESYKNKPIEFAPNLTYGRSCFWESDTLEKINKLYSPKTLSYEPSKTFETFPDIPYGKSNPNSIHSGWYSVYKCNELKKQYEIENNFEYDLVIRCRFDINLINFNVDLIDPNIVYVCGELNRTNKLGLPNDLFAISSSKNIDLYSSIYTRLSEFRYKIVGDFVGENLVEYVLRNVNIEFCERDTLFVDVVRLNKS